MKTENLNFKEAKELADKGSLIARAKWDSWNGEFLFSMKESKASIKDLEDSSLPQTLSDFYNNQLSLGVSTSKRLKTHQGEAVSIGGGKYKIPENPDYPERYWGTEIGCLNFEWADPIEELTFKPCLAYHNSGEITLGWQPTIEDAMATDWKVFSEEL